jgi:hypothetical protein
VPNAPDPQLAAAIAAEAGHRANVTKWVAAGILTPAGGRPGTGIAYAWTAEDAEDARVARRLLDLALPKALVAGALAEWRRHRRPHGYVGAYGRSELLPCCWTDTTGVVHTLATGASVVAVPTW